MQRSNGQTVQRFNGAPSVQPKTRSDAWGEDLPEETRWELYALTKPPTEEERQAGRAWLRDFRRDVLPHLSLQGHVAPSQSAWYRFLGRMRREERVRLVASVESSSGTAGDLARAAVDDATAAEAYKALSVDAAMGGDAKAAALYAQAANAFRDRAQRAEELKLKADAQKTRDDQLRLAREKFEEEAARRTAAEARAEKAEAEAEDLKAKVGELEKALRDAGKVNVADPARVAAEVDRILGRKPRQ